MKRIMTYLLCAVMLMLALSACGNGTVTSPKPTNDVVVTGSPSIIPSITPSANVTTSPDASIMPEVSGSPAVGGGT